MKTILIFLAALASVSADAAATRTHYVGMFYGDGVGLTNLPSAAVSGDAVTNNDTRAVVFFGGLTVTNSATGNWIKQTNSTLSGGLTNQGATPVLTLNFSSGAVSSTLGTATFNTFVGNGSGITNINPRIKVGFSTNYTATMANDVLFCTGTNQVITLLDATNAATTPGKMLTIVAASTTGSVTVTNANGAQTILGAASFTVTATNRLTVISDGFNWW